MTYATKMEKSTHGGWRAETNIPLGTIEVKEFGKIIMAERELSITTMKRSNGRITSYASVSIVHGEEGHKIRTTEIFGDFSKKIIERDGKATEKSVKICHEQALILADGVKAEAEAFYAMKKQSVAA